MTLVSSSPSSLNGYTFGIVSRAYNPYDPLKLHRKSTQPPESPGHKDVYDYLTQHGAKVITLTSGNTVVKATSEGLSAYIDGKKYDQQHPLKLDAVYNSINNRPILEFLRSQKIPITNTPSAIRAADDKSETALLLAKKKLPVVGTYLVGSQEAINQVVTETSCQDLVLKKPIGNGGNAVRRVSHDTLQSLGQTLFSEDERHNANVLPSSNFYKSFTKNALMAMGYYQQPVILQHIIPKKEDYRVYVCDGKPVAFTIRKMPVGVPLEIRTNKAQGGIHNEVPLEKALHHPVYSKLIETAITSSTAIPGLQMVAVDLLLNKDRPEVIELNTAFAMEALTDKTHVLEPLAQLLKKMADNKALVYKQFYSSQAPLNVPSNSSNPTVSSNSRHELSASHLSPRSNQPGTLFSASTTEQGRTSGDQPAHSFKASA